MLRRSSDAGYAALTVQLCSQGSAHTLVAEKLSSLFGQELKQPKGGPGS